MSVRSTSLAVLILVGIVAGGGIAQEKLGDLVRDGGYDWVIGRWVATTDDGQEVEVKYDWALDKHVILSDTTMGEFHHHGMITFSSERQEVIDVGADNRGGMWKGSWYEDWSGLIHSVEHTGVDGEVHKGEIVHNRVDADTITIAFYAVDSSGARASEPWGKLTYKRKPAAKEDDSAFVSRYTDYTKLSDLVSEGGYEWLMGKWSGTEEGRQYTLVMKPILDGHAAIMEAQIDDFQYRGMITLASSGEEINQIGADNMGGTWKSSWEDSYEGAVHKIEYTKPDGTIERMEHVFVKTDNDTFQVKEYAVESGGYRAAASRGSVTFKRQK